MNIEEKHQRMIEVIEDEVALFVWSAKSPKCEISLGMDTFLVENGVIYRQTAYLAIED